MAQRSRGKSFAGRTSSAHSRRVCAHGSFEALGNALVPDKAQPKKWINAMTLRFQTDDARCRWLNTTLGVWEGDFDIQTGVSTGHVYARLNASTPR